MRLCVAGLGRVALWFGLLAGCASDPGDDAGTGGGTSAPEFPSDTSQAGLEAFLDAGSYKAEPWTFDAVPRAAEGNNALVNPHGRMRVFFNPTAVASIAAGNGEDDDAPHSQYAMVVKELYSAEDELLGRAVTLKTGEDNLPQSWLYFCDGPPGACTGQADTSVPLYGAGEFACHACHGGFFFAPVP